MRRLLVATAGLAIAGAAASLGGCVHYHQEVAGLRMPRPTAESAGLMAYGAPDADYPSVGGNILKGTAPKSGAAYDATTAGKVPPPPGPGNP